MFTSSFITNFITQKFMHLYLINENLRYEWEETQNPKNNKSTASFRNLNPTLKFIRKPTKISRKELVNSYFTCNNHQKKYFELGTTYLKYSLSTNNFVKRFIDLETMKKIVLDEDQATLFACTPNHNLQEIDRNYRSTILVKLRLISYFINCQQSQIKMK